MRKHMLSAVEACRVIDGPLGSDAEDGFNGCFIIKWNFSRLNVIVSDQMGWDHVSVSKKRRCPTWKEMQYIKTLFWEPEETVLQFHPAESVYVNWHRYTLHMWRDQADGIKIPPDIMV